MASRNIGTLSVDLVLKAAGFVKGLDAAGRAAGKQSKSMGAQFESLAKKLAAFGTAAATGLAYFTKQAIDAQDKIRDLSKSTGASTEFLSEIKSAAELSGTSLDAVANSFTKMSKAAVASIENITGPAANAFKKLGVEVQNADGTVKDLETLFLETSDAVAGFEDGVGKTAVVTAIFGKSAAQLIPLLNAGADGLRQMQQEAEEWGLTVSKESSDAADEFNDNLTKIGYARQGFVNRFASAVLPTLAEFSGEIVASLKEGLKDSGDAIIFWGELVTGVLAVVLDSFRAGFSVLKFGFETVGKTAGAGMAKFVAQITGNFDDAARIQEEWEADIADGLDDLVNDPNLGKYQRIWEDMKDGVRNFGAAIEEIDLSELPKRKLTFVDEGAAQKLQTESASALATIQNLITGIEQQAATMDASQLETMEYSLATGELARTFEAAGAAAALAGVDLEDYRERLLESAAAQDEMARASKAAAEASAAVATMQSEAAAMTERNLTPLERMNEALADVEQKRNSIDALSGEPLISAETAEREILAIQKSYEDAIRGVNTFAERASENIQDSIADGLINGFDDGAKGMLESFGKLIQEILAQAVAADIAKALFGGGGVNSGGGLFGFIGDLFRREKGGPVSAGTTYVVGERGPELFTKNVRAFHSNVSDLVRNRFGDQNVSTVNRRGPDLFTQNVDQSISSFAEFIRHLFGDSSVSIVGARGPQLLKPLVSGSIIPNNVLERVHELFERTEVSKATSRLATDTSHESLQDRITQLRELFSQREQVSIASNQTHGEHRHESSLIERVREWREIIKDHMTHFMPSLNASILFRSLGFDFGGGRASGGPVSPGTVYLVGERGPELFTAPASGRIIPNALVPSVVKSTSSERNEHNQRSEVRFVEQVKRLHESFVKGSAGVNIMQSLFGFGGFRAAGGMVSGGRTYMVGERGGELFMPNLNAGLPTSANAGPVVNITQVNNIEGSNLGPEQMVAILDENNKKLKGEFLQELRRGTYS